MIIEENKTKCYNKDWLPKLLQAQAERKERVMNTIWLKIAGLAICVVVVIVAIGMLTSSDTEQSEQPKKTFYDKAEEDKERFLAEPEPIDVQDAQEQKQEQQQVQQEPEVSQPTTLYFEELSDIDKTEAERLLNVAVPGRSIGRLPVTGFKLMVDTCRQIIQKWPESWYAYRAQQMLADMPTRFRSRYKITEKELDISKFYEQRPGTQPFVEGSD